VEGIDWDLDWEWNSGIQRWTGTAWFPDSDSPGSATTGFIPVTYHLLCAGGDDDDFDHPGKNFTLWSDAGCIGMQDAKVALDTSECDPLALVFGPYPLLHSDLACDICWPPLEPDCMMNPSDPRCSGEFYIVVTER